MILMRTLLGLNDTQSKKIILILAFSSLAAGISSLRFQYVVPFGLAILVLYILTLYYSSSVPLFFLIIIFPLIYSGAKFDSVLGYDAQSVTVLTNELNRSSWPIEGVVYSGGFPETPFVHIHAVVVHQISNIALFNPEKLDQIVVQAVLPYIYVIVMLLIAYSIAKRVNSDIPPQMTVLPVVLFIPLYYWVSFRRQSAGYLLFILIVYLMVLYSQLSIRDKKRMEITSLILISFASIVVSHHMSTAVLLVFMSVSFAISKAIFSNVSFKPLRVLYATLILTAFVIVWYLWTLGDRSLFFAGVFYRIAGILSGPEEMQATIEAIDKAPLNQFRNGISKWVYQFIVGTGVLIFAYELYVGNRASKNALYVYTLFGFGGIVAFLAALGTQGLVIPTTRLMIFFVLTGGVLAMQGWQFFVSKFEWISVRYVLMVLFVVSALMVPPHYVSSMDPPRGEKSDRISEQMYHTSAWVGKFDSDRNISGDAKVFAVLTPFTQNYVNLNATRVNQGELPRGDFVARKKNERSYRGRFPNDGILLATVPTKNLLSKANSERNKIYTSGGTSIFSKEASSVGAV